MGKFHNDCLLVRVLQNPQILTGLTTGDWDLLIRQARRADLLGKLAVLAEQQLKMSDLNDNISNVLHAAKAISNKHRQTVQWEIHCITRALEDVPGPVIFLKGAAYVYAGMTIAEGRLFSDVDVLVNKSDLNKAENLLIINGWATIKQSDYDQMYYRKWMHEIPPLRHRRRRTVVDLHHHILPETARYKPAIDKLIADSVQLDERHDIRVLAPIDMLLHSMTHLFCEGEFSHGLRDLVDIDGMLRYNATQAGFWEGLVKRATELQLTIPLFYALRYAKCFLATPIPDTIWSLPDILQPGSLMLKQMDAIFMRVLVPEHPSCQPGLYSLARFAVYIRGHYLRMPFHLLIPHLLVKLIMGWKTQEKS